MPILSTSTGQAQKVDTLPEALQDAVDATAAHGLQWKTAIGRDRRAGRVPPRVQLRHAGETIDYRIETRRTLRPDLLGAVVRELREPAERTLLVADYVTPPMAERLKAQGQEFIDAAGNAYIDAPPLFVWVKGEKPKTRRQPYRRPGRAFAPTGLQILFALLCRPALANEPYRTIADAAGVAHGSVGWVLPELQALGHVAEVGGRRRLLDVAELLRQWTEAYLRTLRPKLFLGRYTGIDLARWQDLHAPGQAIGGEVAAAHITGHLHPGTLTLYADGIDNRFLARHRLRAADDGEVEILRRFWRFDADAALAPLPLVFADLLRFGDLRGLETAELVRRRYLDGLE